MMSKTDNRRDPPASARDVRQAPSPRAGLNWRAYVRRPRFVLTLGVWGLYLGTFVLLYGRAGPAITAATTLPVAVTAWLFGMRAGILSAILAFPVNMLLITLAGGSGLTSMFRTGLPGSIFLVLSGAAIGRLHDLGERVKFELAERKRAQEQLVISEKMAALGRLTAGLAHEINTPLAAVRTALMHLAELVAEYRRTLDSEPSHTEAHQEIAAEMHTMLQLAERAAQRLSQFMNSIKSQTRDLAPHERQYFNATHIIEEAILLLNHPAQEAGCLITFTADPNVINLYGAPGQLAQVVTNLGMNAIQASSPNGGPITIRLLENSTGVELRVSDTGHGIPPDVLPKIFDPLFTTRPFGESVGLGLTIVHDIVTGHFDGAIEVASRVGQGATFIVRLPRPLEKSHAPEN